MPISRWLKVFIVSSVIVVIFILITLFINPFWGYVGSFPFVIFWSLAIGELVVRKLRVQRQLLHFLLVMLLTVLLWVGYGKAVQELVPIFWEGTGLGLYLCGDGGC